MLDLNVLKLISEELKVFTRATGFSIPTCYVVLFAKTLANTDSESFSSSVNGMWGISL